MRGHDSFLKLGLHLLYVISLVSDFSLKLRLECLEARNLLVDEGKTLLNQILALKKTLFCEDGTDHFVNHGVVVEHFELRLDHFVFRLLLSHLLLVHDNLAVLYTLHQLRKMLWTTYRLRCA